MELEQKSELAVSVLSGPTCLLKLDVVPNFSGRVLCVLVRQHL